MPPEGPQVGVGEGGGEEGEGEEEGQLVEEAVLEDRPQVGHGLVIFAKLSGGQKRFQSLQSCPEGHLASGFLPFLKMKSKTILNLKVT